MSRLVKWAFPRMSSSFWGLRMRSIPVWGGRRLHGRRPYEEQRGLK
jgi:hypothetical protein